MGSDSGSDSDSNSAEAKAAAEAAAAEKAKQDAAKEAKARKDYLDKLSKAKGWERFSLGTKYGYKDWTSVKEDDTAETRDKIDSIFGKTKSSAGGDAKTNETNTKTAQNASNTPGSSRAVQSLLKEDALTGLSTPSLSPTIDDSVGPLGLNKTKDVSKVQAALVDEGDLDEQTGYIGTKTLDATKAFQDKKGLKVDGQINPGGPTERALLGARSEVASPYSRAPAGTPSIEQQTKTWAESQQRQQQAKQTPPSGYFSKNGVTFTDNWANDLIGGRATATMTPKDGLLARTPDQKAADVGEQPMGSQATSTNPVASAKPNQLGAKIIQGTMEAPRMDEAGNWFNNQGRMIENPNEPSVIRVGAIGDAAWALGNWFEDQVDGTAKKEERDRKRAIRVYEKYQQQFYPGYEFMGNNLLEGYNNTMSDENKKQMAKEIGTIMGKELIGGGAKISGIAKTLGIPAAKKVDPLGGALDYFGDHLLDSAQKDKKRWGY